MVNLTYSLSASLTRAEDKKAKKYERDTVHTFNLLVPLYASQQLNRANLIFLNLMS